MSDTELTDRHARKVAANLDVAPENIRVCPECGRTIVLITADGNPARCTCESRAPRMLPPKSEPEGR